MKTIFEANNLLKEKVSFEELMNQHGKILPQREELSVINYNMGYPGYDFYQSSYHVPNPYMDNHREYDFRMDCYGNYYDDKYHPAKYDHDDWKYDKYDWKDDKYDNDYWKRDDNVIHNDYRNYDAHRYDAYSPYNNTYAGYYGSQYSGYGYGGNPYYGTYV
jgi:hypothetical protein